VSWIVVSSIGLLVVSVILLLIEVDLSRRNRS